MTRNTASSAILLALALVGTLSSVAIADILEATLSDTTLKKDLNGHPCQLELTTVEGPEVTFQLSDYEDTWRINLFVKNVSSALIPFFDVNGLLDMDRFRRQVHTIELGGSEFRIAESFLYAIFRTDLNEESSAEFTIIDAHNVSGALKAMGKENIGVNGILSVSTPVGAFEDFQTCAFAAMDLLPETPVETDFRAEFRHIFERSFVLWIKEAARADACGQLRYDDGEVERIIDEAEDAFYPGTLLLSKRSAFRSELELAASSARTSGLVEGLSNCIMAEQMAEMSLSPVREAIRSAARIK